MVSDRFENGRKQLFAGRAFPSRPRQFSEGASGLAVHHYLDIMKWSAGFPTQEPTLWVIDLMCGGIPPTGRKIQPPNECQRIIDDDDLLMVGRADGMRAVLHGMQPPRDEPACIGGPFTFNAINQMMIPCEHVDLQLVLPAQKFLAKLSDMIGESIRVLIDDYSGPAVEIPS
jgi:hypothetical protein